MKTLIVLALIVAATASAQTTLVSDNAPKLQNIERSAVAWKRAIANEEATYRSIEADTSKIFVLEKAKFGDFSSRAKYGTKTQKLAAIRRDIESLKAARDEEMSAMCADLK